jgi:hypothetical protein
VFAQNRAHPSLSARGARSAAASATVVAREIVTAVDAELTNITSCWSGKNR